jgi:hypothetical protein
LLRILFLYKSLSGASKLNVGTPVSRVNLVISGDMRVWGGFVNI